ncbi:MAG: Ig-like domain-containing protein [Dehalococcoidia bacterium]
MVSVFLFIAVLSVAALQTWWGDIQTVAAEEPSLEKLSIKIAPPVLPADGNTQPVVYVQLVGQDGVPKLASQDIEVSLISSDPRVLRVPDSVSISAGESYATAAITTTSIPGNATITAVSSVLPPVTAEAKTISFLGGLPPIRLALYTAPADMLPGGQPPGRLSVVLLGADNRPVPAQENTDVLLSSSDPNVVWVAERVTIPKGQHFVTTDLNPLAVGSATLSAVSSGFVSQFIGARVVEPGDVAEALELYLSPPVMRSGTGSHRAVIVQAVDRNGLPVYFPCAQVHLSSSSPLSAEVTPVAEGACGRDAQYAVGTVTMGGLPDTLIITAVASGLAPTIANLEVHGQEPAQLVAYVAPGELLAVEEAPGYLVVQALDADGLPVTSHQGIAVGLVGGGRTLPEEVTVPKGQSFVRVGLGGLPPGEQVQLWLVNPAMTSAQVSVQSHSLPITIEVVDSEEPLFAGGKREIIVRVQSAGAPVPQAGLIWTATNGILSDVTPVTDRNGEARATFTAKAPGDGTVQVSVSKVGYAEVSTQATIAVVVAPETSNPPPKLFGVPVFYLLLAIPVVLMGYLVYRFYPAIKQLRIQGRPPVRDR